MKVYLDAKQDPAKLKSLYFHMANVENNVKNSSFSVGTLDCLSAQVNGQRVNKNDEWEKTHNYRGVYDMIHSQNRYVN